MRIEPVGFSIAGSMISSEMAKRGYEIKAYEEHKNPYEKIRCFLEANGLN
ncbi:MAG: hypothetical protein NTY68_04240 [Candidatus Micrarchaeota archaeon]|nr:hypothetical protein [Candidatus Micrarchaeota archaeon]